MQNDWPLDRDFVIREARSAKDRDLRFSDLLPYLKAGVDDAIILDLHPLLKESKLPKIHAYYELYKQKHDQGTASSKIPMRVMCDENTSKIHLLSSSREFAFVTGTDFEGINGGDDHVLVDTAQRLGINRIFGRDLHFWLKKDKETEEQRARREGDLTHIVAEMWAKAYDVPVSYILDGNPVPYKEGVHLVGLLRLDEKTFVPEIFADAIAAFADDIYRLDSQKIWPFLQLTQSGVKPTAIKKVKALPKNRAEGYAWQYRIFLMSPNEWKDRETPEVLQKKRKLTRTIAKVMRDKDDSLSETFTLSAGGRVALRRLDMLAQRGPTYKPALVAA